MNLSKTLLQAVCVGMTVGIAASCTTIVDDIAELNKPHEVTTCLADGAIDNDSPKKVVPFDCPACGLG